VQHLSTAPRGATSAPVTRFVNEAHGAAEAAEPMKVDGLKGSKYPRGGVWWVKYYQFGRPIRESTKSSDERQADKLLLKRGAAIEEGRTINPQVNRCKVDKLLDLVVTWYRVKSKKDLDHVERRVKLHLRPFFGGRAAGSVTSELLLDYVAKRQRAGAKDATINRELANLQKAYSLGIEAKKVDYAPPFKSAKLRERNTRTGFFNRAQLEAVLAHLRPELGAFFRFAYFTGWRRGEIRSLQWRQVDFEAGTIRLDAGSTKNDDPRLFRLTTGVRALLEAQRAYTDRVNHKRGVLCPWVFHRAGKPIKDYYGAWRTACLNAGLAQRLPSGRIKTERVPHDFRRSCARNLIRAGIHQTVARQITGHRTESMYTRYNITAESDLAEATERLDEYLEREASRLPTGHNLGTIATLPTGMHR
jgi:integrase